MEPKNGKTQYDLVIKIIVVGEQSVGKTCLNYRYCDDIYSNTTINTIGVDSKIKYVQIKDKKVKLNIYDTSG